MATVILTSVAALALATPAWASGGGGCGGPVTDEAGRRVMIRSFCFTSTITRVDVGQTVRFVNRDRTQHDVLGANGAWGGYDTLDRGDAVSYRFTEPGVYPYVCTWHPGMVGAVVVGAGVPVTASGTTTAEGPVVSVPDQGMERLEAAAPVTPTGEPAVAWTTWIAAAVGLAAAVTGSVHVRRRRRTVLV